MKKILSVLMCVMMIVAMMPAMAMAETVVEEAATAEELQAAFNAGGAVKLTKNIVVALSETGKAFEIAADKEVVLDLNGCAISVTSTYAGATSVIAVYGNLTILDNGEEGTIALTEALEDPTFGYATDTIYNEGTLTINGGTIINNCSGASYAVDTNCGGKTIINAGKVYASDSKAVRAYSWSEDTASTLVITGGHLEGTNAVYLHNLGSNSANKISATITGGTFVSNSSSDIKMALYSLCNNGGNVDININGGTFNGDVVFGGYYEFATYVPPLISKDRSDGLT